MILDWLHGWWATLRQDPAPNAWEEDPYILAERERQHEQGIVDHATVSLMRDELERRRQNRDQQMRPTQ